MAQVCAYLALVAQSVGRGVAAFLGMRAGDPGTIVRAEAEKDHKGDQRTHTCG